jgi:hypothetical protein
MKIQAHAHTNKQTNKHAYTHTHANTHTRANTYIHRKTQRHTLTNIHQIHTYTHTHTCIHIHTVLALLLCCLCLFAALSACVVMPSTSSACMRLWISSKDGRQAGLLLIHVFVHTCMVHVCREKFFSSFHAQHALTYSRVSQFSVEAHAKMYRFGLTVNINDTKQNIMV